MTTQRSERATPVTPYPVVDIPTRRPSNQPPETWMRDTLQGTGPGQPRALPIPLEPSKRPTLLGTGDVPMTHRIRARSLAPAPATAPWARRPRGTLLGTGPATSAAMALELDEQDAPDETSGVRLVEENALEEGRETKPESLAAYYKLGLVPPSYPAAAWDTAPEASRPSSSPWLSPSWPPPSRTDERATKSIVIPLERLAAHSGTVVAIAMVLVLLVMWALW